MPRIWTVVIWALVSATVAHSWTLFGMRAHNRAQDQILVMAASLACYQAAQIAELRGEEGREAFALCDPPQRFKKGGY